MPVKYAGVAEHGLGHPVLAPGAAKAINFFILFAH